MTDRFTVEERRRRLATRHGLVSRLPDPVAVADAVVALHATDPATVFLSAAARLDVPSLEAVADHLYERRTLVRVLAMRRTLFVASVAGVEAIERSSTDDVARRERDRLEGFLGDTGIADPTRWLAEARDEVIAALPDEGAPARTITTLVPRLATKIVMGAGTNHEVSAGATSRVLAMLANEGVLVRGRPAGTWTGRQYVWHRRSQWLGPTPTPRLDRGSASTELVGRWLRSFGPGTFADLKWWTGWTAAQLRDALDRLDVVEVDLDGRPGLVLADDREPTPDPGPWAALLPSLDPTPMGWKERDWYLGPHRAPLFDRSGNIGPTIWLDGRVVGGWGQRPDGEVVTELLTEVAADGRTLIEAEVGRLQSTVGDTAVRPSFPTPLQKELSH